MALVRESIPHLVNGVSQQPISFRNPGQGSAQVNGLSSIQGRGGQVKRPPTEHVAKLSASSFGEAYLHTINRDTSERYVVVITDGDIQVFDLDGNEKTVNFKDAAGNTDATVADYLTYQGAGTPSAAAFDIKRDFRALTVADYTFITNRTVEVAKDTGDLSPSRDEEALVFVKNAEQDVEYTMTVRYGATVKTHSVTPTTAVQSQTTWIANGLSTEFEGGGSQDITGDSFTVTQDKNYIHLKRSTGNFTIQVNDDRGDTHIAAIRKKVGGASDLPPNAPNGFTCRVVGDKGNEFDEFYVKFETDGSANTVAGTGAWVETVEPNNEWKLDENTMPHVLVREGDGTFTFQPATWDNRLAGDSTLAPDPSFVGREIEEVFFTANRLGFLSGENVILSESGQFFNFYPITTAAVLDTDRIDVAASNVKVSNLRNVTTFDQGKGILLMSDQTQFLLDYGDVLSPSTVRLLPITSYESDADVSPVNVDRFVYFLSSQGRFSTVREYSTREDITVADEITSHVPQYVPANIVKMTGSSDASMLAILSEDEVRRIYVYRTFILDGQKLQSSWSYWELEAGASILNIDFIRTDLFLVVERSDGVFLEKIDLTPAEGDGVETYSPRLDRLLEGSTLTPSYDAGTNRTTWTLPYEIDASTDGLQVVEAANGTTPGRIIPHTRPADTTIQVTGDFTTVDVWIGRQFEHRYTFSPVIHRKSSSVSTSVVADPGLQLQLRMFSIVYESASGFRVEVTPSLRDTITHYFSANQPGNLVGALASASGSYRFPIKARSDEVTIEFINDTPYPAVLVGAEWEAMATQRSRSL